MATSVLKYVCLVVLLCNAIFWGLLSHKTHCRVTGALRVKCVKHKYHQTLGAVCAALAGCLGVWILATVKFARK
jgi:hypothetical protein